MAIMAKGGGGAVVVGGGGVFKPFPGVGGFDWRISRIEVGGLDGSLAVVGARFPWGVFVLWGTHVQLRGFETATKCGGGGIWLLCCRSNAVVSCARDKIYMFEGTWVLTM